MGSNLTVELFGLRLKNPLILASGILGISGKLLKRIGKSGAGAVVTKSSGLFPRKGYNGPIIVEVPNGLINSLGLPNPGIKEMVKEINEVKKNGVPIIVSIYGFDVEQYCKAAKIASYAGADAIELNVSCPHVKEVSVEIGQSPELVSEIVRGIKKIIDVPTIVKLSPNISDVVSIARAVEKAGANAITAINTVKAMSIDVEIQRPVLSNKIGGLSGPAIKPIALRCVYEIFEEVNIPIIGCGGVTYWSDVIEYMLAGASAVQIGTSIIQKDIQIFKNIQKGIEDYMQKKDFDSIQKIIGLAHK